MRLNDVYFLPGDDPSGWKVASSVNQDDSNNLGSFVTVTLRGTKPGQLDFEYHISAGKTGNDILVSLGRSNHTGKAVDLVDMDYFVSNDARLGGTTDKMDQPGDDVPESRLLRPVRSDPFDRASNVRGESRGQGHGHGQQPADGTRDHVKGSIEVRGGVGLAGEDPRPDAGPRILQLQSHHSPGKELSRRETAHRLQHATRSAPWSTRRT